MCSVLFRIGVMSTLEIKNDLDAVILEVSVEVIDALSHIKTPKLALNKKNNNTVGHNIVPCRSTVLVPAHGH